MNLARGRPAWLFAAGPGRVLAEAGLAAFAATLLLAALFASVPDPARRSGALVIGPAGVGILVGWGAALRLRRPDARRWRRTELARITLPWLATWLGGTIALLGGDLFAGRMGWAEADGRFDPWSAPALAGIAALVSAAAYAVARGLLLAWPRWDRLRRTRLLWALTHAQLAASLSLTLALAAILTVVGMVAIVGQAWLAAAAATDSFADAIVSFLARVVEAGVPSPLVFLLASLVIGVVVVLPVALVSVVVLPRTTRRLENLAAATAALRAGDLAARVPVVGEDEVARLQADFNAMATDLERSLAALAAERDAVATLLADRRQLVAAVSHELRTPLATLRGYLDSALGRWDGTPPPPPTLRADLAVMAAETERLGRLIDDLFALSRAEAGRLPIALGPTDVAALLRRAAATVAPLAWQRGRVEVLTDAPVRLPPALADPDRLDQVVRNLVANAVRHTPPGGLVLLRAVATHAAITIEVNDTGTGIAATDLPRIWDRFYRAPADPDAASARAHGHGHGHEHGHEHDRDRDGAGLGLALVKELTEAMGGSVAVETAPGTGSSFSLRLPLAPPPTPPFPPPPS